MAHLHELSFTLNCEKLHLLPKYERAPASPANADFLFSGPCSVEFLSSLKTWIVPWSEAQETYEFVLSIVISVMTAYTVPLLNSQSISYVAMLKTLIKVPLFDAVANKLPS